MSESKELNVPSGYSAVLYSDGGYHSSEKAGGWGVHGYVYSANDLPTKGSGCPKATPTDKGYIEAKDQSKAVKVINYIDQFGGVPRATSNNQTELLATKQALEYVLEKGINTSIIYSDSKYVVDGINKYRDVRMQRGYVRPTGEDIPNKADWQAVDALLNELRNRNSEVTLAWIKGHNGNHGNEIADQWASKGSCIALNGYDFTYKLEQPAEGYWKSVAGHNRLLDQPKWYFNSLKEDRKVSACGRHVYWTGDHGDDEDTGKPQSDYSNAVLYLKEPAEVLEKVRDHFVEMDKGQVGNLFIGVMRNILNSNISADIMRFGMNVFRRNKANLSLVTDNKLPLVYHQTPTGLSYYNVDNLQIMQNRLNEFLEGDKSIVVTDLTDLLYEASEKKGVVTRKLRKEISNAVKHLDVSVNYNTGLARELRAMDVVPVKTAKVRLIVGADIIGRNALAALAESVKRVVALTWRESETVFRYATVIETENDIGIWANPFGNFKLVK